MSKIQVNHIKTQLDNLFTDKIDLSDVRSVKPEDIKKQFYSRALAAYSLHIIASASIDEAAIAVTDTYDDNGIDAVYFDEQLSTLYLVQSKMIEAGSGEPENGDMVKFSNGITDLIEEKYDRFNAKIQGKLPIIKEAFNDSRIKLNIIIAYTGRGFSIHNRRVIDDLISYLNDSTEWAFFTDFNLKTGHDSMNSVLAGKPIEAELTLSNWGVIDEPFSAYYGQISASELANLWKHHRKKLFSDNIRNFIGLSEINTSILNTIENEPEKFIYFNNGVTILCNVVSPLPAKTIGKTTGVFDCKGITIINGAQTVGSLGIALDRFPDKLERSKVFVRLIPLENAPEGFGNRITVASNTQNKIEKRDFVTLDPIQLNIRTELLLTNVNYHYKRTDETISYDDKNCTLEEATVSLACAWPEPTLAVTAKREIGRLWDDINKAPYRDIFNENLKVVKLWRCVIIYRETSKYLNELKASSTGRERSIYTYGNYFATHIIINSIPVDVIMNPSADFSQYVSNELKELIRLTTNKLVKTTEERYPTALIHQLFRNYSKCTDLKQHLSPAQKDDVVI